jgi:hypothetical protein
MARDGGLPRYYPADVCVLQVIYSFSEKPYLTELGGPPSRAMTIVIYLVTQSAILCVAGGIEAAAAVL